MCQAGVLCLKRTGLIYRNVESVIYIFCYMLEL